MPPAFETDLYTQLERIPTKVFERASDASANVARAIADLIRKRAKEGKKCVLGLATGSTPIGVYNELIRLHKEEKLSFKDVITFNLDEYYPMQPNELQSYVRFMNEHLFDHIDIDRANVHIPDGTQPIEKVYSFCQQYEQMIADAGGIDIQLLGIGRTGHIGFNEPGSAKNSPTRLISLDRVTRLDAAGSFFGEENVPRRAITMGVGSILRARQIILMAFGEHKASVVVKAVEGEVTSAVSASFLQDHANAKVILDKAAAASLTRFKHPWLVGPIEWTPQIIRKAVIWLARKTDTPLLKLTDEEYNEHGLQDLLAEQGPAYKINLDVFRELVATITGWPGGKPSEIKRPGDLRRKTDDIFPKRAIVFSPHPDDDVISMGGTLIRLVDQGHEVHVAYQVSGNIAVFDETAIRFADFAAEFNRMFGIDAKKSAEIEQHVEEFLKNKKHDQSDSESVRRIKGLIRRGEAKAAGRACNIPIERLHFLDMPFYETGTVRKKPLGPEDVQIIVNLLNKVKPHQIYAAGDLSDPHGTHRVCLTAIFQAIEKVRDQKWFSDCEVWLYRGAWEEWPTEEIDMAVPLSPQELDRKRQAIFAHESQKDKVLFPGTDQREFWQRAEDRNRATAKSYDDLGLAEYEAIEGFVRWHGDDPRWS